MVESIPFFSLDGRMMEIGSEVRKAVLRTLDSGDLIEGPALCRFEENFGSYLGIRHVVGVGNGLDGLRLALLALGVKPGDEVIVPAFTFVATALAVIQVGAKPVFVDVEPDSGNIDVEKIPDAIGSRTVAVIGVHLFGRPCDVVGISQLTSEAGLLFIEDAAQAHGAQVLGRRVGTWGDAAAFSFYPTKNLGAVGDAGAVAVPSEGLAESIKSLRSYGRGASKYDHVTAGWNSRLDPIQASVLDIFLRKLDEWNERRQTQAARYLEALEGARDIEPLSRVTNTRESVWHHFVVRAQRRREVRRSLDSMGVGTDVHYPVPVYASPAIAVHTADAKNFFPIADALAREVVSLPMHPWLGKSGLVAAQVVADVAG